MKNFDIAIVGGGASGLIAAISAAQRKRHLQIAIVERGQRVGRKLLSTGNGRCNLTNLHAANGGYHGDRAFAAQVIARFPPEDVRKFFQNIGLRTYAEEDGRVYPLCNQAAAVLDVLRLRCRDLNVEEICEFECSSIRKKGGDFLLISGFGEAIRSKKVILCAGGPAAPKIGGTDAGVRLLRSLGHETIPCRPALTQIETDAEPIRALKGLRFQGNISLLVDGRVQRCEQGEILFAETGLSGIAVMQLSEPAGDALQRKKRAEVSLQILQDEPESLSKELYMRAHIMPARELNDFLTGITVKRIGQTLCKQANAVPLTRSAESLTETECTALAHLLTDWRLPVKSVKGFESAQATAGGADPKGFDVQTMQSRIVDGLYAAGEVLNVDGDCGGYNLQWAWSSGMLAGQSAAEALP